MTRDEEATAAEADVEAERPPATVRVGLEPLGTEVLIEGTIVALTPDEIVVATASMLPTGTRAFVVIDDAGHLPVVGLVEVVDQQVVLDDVTIELRARFVHLTRANVDRLALLFTDREA